MRLLIEVEGAREDEKRRAHDAVIFDESLSTGHVELLWLDTSSESKICERPATRGDITRPSG